jgi:hypothetical protein
VVQPEHARADTSDLFPVHAGFPGALSTKAQFSASRRSVPAREARPSLARGTRTAARVPEDDDSADADGAGDENDQKQATEVLAAGVSAAQDAGGSP